jgi:glycosyltransferase involved in cell wall biosynthesis
MVSSMYKIKRPLDLIEAFSIVSKQIKQAHLVLVGGGITEIIPLQQFTNNLPIKNRIHILGSVPDPVNIIKHFTVGVLCSESEGLSNAILEYMGCGKPVICTNTGGNPELVQDKYNGFLINVGDVGALADRILQLLSNPKLALEMGMNAQKSFGKTFINKKMVNSYMDLYENLLEDH